MDPKFFRKYADIITEAEHPVNEDANAQKGAQAILQALSPEEEQQLADIVQKAGNDPKRAMQALGIPQALQQAQQGQVEEGIAPTLGGKIVQALYTAGLIGTTVGAYAAGSPALGLIAAPLLMAAGTIYGSAPGQVGSKFDHQPVTGKTHGEYSLKKGQTLNPGEQMPVAGRD
jgi:hypothetical protein